MALVQTNEARNGLIKPMGAMASDRGELPLADEAFDYYDIKKVTRPEEIHDAKHQTSHH